MNKYYADFNSDPLFLKGDANKKTVKAQIANNNALLQQQKKGGIGTAGNMPKESTAQQKNNGIIATIENNVNNNTRATVYDNKAWQKLNIGNRHIDSKGQKSNKMQLQKNPYQTQQEIDQMSKGLAKVLVEQNLIPNDVYTNRNGYGDGGIIDLLDKNLYETEEGVWLYKTPIITKEEKLAIAEEEIKKLYAPIYANIVEGSLQQPINLFEPMIAGIEKTRELATIPLTTLDGAITYKRIANLQRNEELQREYAQIEQQLEEALEKISREDAEKIGKIAKKSIGYAGIAGDTLSVAPAVARDLYRYGYLDDDSYRELSKVLGGAAGGMVAGGVVALVGFSMLIGIPLILLGNFAGAKGAEVVTDFLLSEEGQRWWNNLMQRGMNAMGEDDKQMVQYAKAYSRQLEW